MTRSPDSQLAQRAHEFIAAHPEGVSYAEISDHLGMDSTKGMTSFMATLLRYTDIYLEGHKLFVCMPEDEELYG